MKLLFDNYVLNDVVNRFEKLNKKLKEVYEEYERLNEEAEQITASIGDKKYFVIHEYNASNTQFYNANRIIKFSRLYLSDVSILLNGMEGSKKDYYSVNDFDSYKPIVSFELFEPYIDIVKKSYKRIVSNCDDFGQEFKPIFLFEVEATHNDALLKLAGEYITSPEKVDMRKSSPSRFKENLSTYFEKTLSIKRERVKSMITSILNGALHIYPISYNVKDNDLKIKDIYVLVTWNEQGKRYFLHTGSYKECIKIVMELHSDGLVPTGKNTVVFVSDQSTDD